MWIQCLIERSKPFPVDMGTALYTFTRDDHGIVRAFVHDEGHRKTLLAIAPPAYLLMDPQPAADPGHEAILAAQAAARQQVIAPNPGAPANLAPNQHPAIDEMTDLAAVRAYAQREGLRLPTDIDLDAAKRRTKEWVQMRAHHDADEIESLKADAAAKNQAAADKAAATAAQEKSDADLAKSSRAARAAKK